MALDAAQLNQLTVILTLAVIFFIGASALPQKVATVALMLLSPFQAIDTPFGTSSDVLAYIVFLALLLRKEQVKLPMLPHFLFLLLWYLVDMSLMPVSTYVQHAVYIFSLISAFLVFWLCYDAMGRFENPAALLNVFFGINVLVAFYCAFQLWLGPGERFVLFGIDEMNMTRVREDGRLTGPFQSAEITAQYLVLMQFLIVHQFWYTTKIRLKQGLILLGTANLGFLLATGSRGEFLLLIGGGLVYLWLFRRKLGTARAIRLATVSALALVVMALIVTNYTQFGGIFDRLAGTEFTEQGIPDTRQVVWTMAWAEIVKEPLIGHGPRFRFHNERRGIIYEDHVALEFPHSLYLYLLFTVGIPGMLLFVGMILMIWIRCWRAMSIPTSQSYYSDLARTGVIIILLFLVDGIKIDQMRLSLADYWYFFFGLCGVLVAACARIESTASEVTQAVDTQR